MTYNNHWWMFIINASIVVKLVMVTLVAASVLSWTIIIQRIQAIKQYHQVNKRFNHRFNQMTDSALLYQQIKSCNNLNGHALIFKAAFREYMDHPNDGVNAQQQLNQLQRIMQLHGEAEIKTLSEDINWLASIGSTSPYIGLFGTVWGIMTAFQALGNVSSATIAMVAPGISEALIATAIGLFAAIPAVIAYNQFQHQINEISLMLENFQQHILSMVARDQMSATSNDSVITPIKGTVDQSQLSHTKKAATLNEHSVSSNQNALHNQDLTHNPTHDSGPLGSGNK